MRPTVRLGKVHGIPVGLHWSALVMFVLFTTVLSDALRAAAGGYAAGAYWLAGCGFAGLFMVGLLAHEYAHARIAQLDGIRVKSITLWMLGGISELDHEPRDPRAGIRIALAGPVASLGVSAVFLALAAAVHELGAGLAAAGLAWLAVVNGMLAVFNILPAAPLDGGRVLAAIIWRVRGDQSAGRRAATAAGIALGFTLAGLGLVVVLAAGNPSGLWLALIGWYLVLSARAEGSYLSLTGELGAATVDRLMSSPPVCGYAHESVANFVGTVAAAHPHRGYPVVDVDGIFVGAILTASLASVPPARRTELRLADVLIPAGRLRTAQRGTRLADPAALPAGRLGFVIVLDGSRPCGVLTAGDVSRAAVVARLGATPDRSSRDDSYSST